MFSKPVRPNMKDGNETNRSTTSRRNVPTREDQTIPQQLTTVLENFHQNLNNLEQRVVFCERTFESTCTLDSPYAAKEECLRNLTEGRDDFEEIFQLNIRKMHIEEENIRVNTLRIMVMLLKCSNEYRRVRDVFDSGQVSTESLRNTVHGLLRIAEPHITSIERLLQENVQRIQSFFTTREFLINHICKND